jgi:hypothetical protein
MLTDKILTAEEKSFGGEKRCLTTLY